MNLVVKQAGTLIKDVHFARGPIYIGRQLESHICLPDLAVSREHAVIYGADNAKWFIEDLGSSNKTYLNKKTIHKSEINDGDILQIANFTIEVQIGQVADTTHEMSLTDTLHMGEHSHDIDAHTPETIVRRYEAKDAPPRRIPPSRMKHYVAATAAILTSDGPEQLLDVLMKIIAEQFGFFHQWIGLRTSTTGELSCQRGYKSTGQDLKLDDLIFQKMISNALAKVEYTRIPLLPKDKQYERTRSGLICPVESDEGCHGIIYVDNAVDQTHYNLQDLDYLALLAIQAGVMLKKFGQAK